MRFYIPITLLLLSLISSEKLLAQQYQINISIAKDNIKANSSGENMIEYTGYSLPFTLSQILEIPIEFIESQDEIKNLRVSIKINSSSPLENEKLKRSIFINLEQQLEIKAELIHERQQVYVMAVDDSQKLTTCTKSNNGVIEKVTLINRTWEGECVQIPSLIEQLHNWYGQHIINEVNFEERYNINIQDFSFEEILITLEQDYGLIVKKEIRAIEILKLKK